MSVIGIMSGAHLSAARNNFTMIASSLSYSTSIVPNAQTYASVRGVVSTGAAFTRPWEASASEFMFHLSIRMTNGTVNDNTRIGWAKDGVLLGSLRFQDSTANARIYINEVLSETSTTPAFSSNVWQTLHVHVKLGGAGVGFIKVYKDGLFGSVLVEEIVDDTDPTSAVTANGFHIRINSVSYVANLVVIDPTDGQDPVTLDAIGTLGVMARVPDADSATNTDWTPDAGGVGYTQIDEIPNSDLDYIEAAAVGDRSTFSHEPAVGSGVEVLAVRYSARIQRVGTAAGSNISITRRRSGTDYDEASQGAPTDGDIEKIFNTEPVASAALTPANVDDTEYGAVTVT